MKQTSEIEIKIIDYGIEVLKQVSDCSESASFRLNNIVKHAKERMKIDKADRKTNKPRILKRINELNSHLSEAVKLLAAFSYDDVTIDGALNKAYLSALCDTGTDQKDREGYWESAGYEMAYSQLHRIQKATEQAVSDIAENTPNAWHKTALSDTATSICELLEWLGEKPTSYPQGLAVRLLKACIELAGGSLGDATYKNAIQNVLAQNKNSE